MPRDITTDSSFQDQLKENVVLPSEMQFSQVMDCLIDRYGLQEICNNPRGRQVLENNLTNTMEQYFFKFKEMKTFSEEAINDMFKTSIIGEKGKVSFLDKGTENTYLMRNNMDDKDKFKAGIKRTTISLNDKGELSLNETGRYEYDKTQDTPYVSYYDRSHTYSKDGVEVASSYTSVNLNENKSDIRGIKDVSDPLVDSYKHKEEYKRINGIFAEVTTTEGKEIPHIETYLLNTEHGIDDIVISEKVDRSKTYLNDDMLVFEKEKYLQIAKDGISRSKYKEALAGMIPEIDEKKDSLQIE